MIYCFGFFNLGIILTLWVCSRLFMPPIALLLTLIAYIRIRRFKDEKHKKMLALTFIIFSIMACLFSLREIPDAVRSAGGLFHDLINGNFWR